MDEIAPMFFLRGAPGAGKTTMAERIRGCGSCFIFETDNFFVDSINRHDYHFDSAFLGIAHSWNQGEVIRACRDCPTVPVIVANTFTHNWEIEPYLKIAKAFKRRVYVITLRTEHDNVHNALIYHEAQTTELASVLYVHGNEVDLGQQGGQIVHRKFKGVHFVFPFVV